MFDSFDRLVIPSIGWRTAGDAAIYLPSVVGVKLDFWPWYIDGSAGALGDPSTQGTHAGPTAPDWLGSVWWIWGEAPDRIAKPATERRKPAMGLKADLARPNTISQIVSVHNALAARIANEFSFDWLSVGGYNVSGSAFGMPDVGLLTLTEQVEAVRRVANVAEAPIIADGDDGYGNYLNVIRLVREMQHAGASAIHIEDQVLPKKCGHMEGKRIVPQPQFISKIKAFVDTRTTEDFLLFARTDAIAVGGFDEAVDRANAYREAGADVIFVEAPTSMEQVERLPQLVDAPLLYNWVFKGKSPLVPRDELLRLGYRFLLQADVLYAVSHALRGYFGELKATSSYGAWADRMISFDEFNELIGLADIVAAEARYEPEAEATRP
jgi:methylisocitrate lyase